MTTALKQHRSWPVETPLVSLLVTTSEFIQHLAVNETVQRVGTSLKKNHLRVEQLKLFLQQLPVYGVVVRLGLGALHKHIPRTVTCSVLLGKIPFQFWNYTTTSLTPKPGNLIQLLNTLSENFTMFSSPGGFACSRLDMKQINISNLQQRINGPLFF